MGAYYQQASSVGLGSAGGPGSVSSYPGQLPQEQLLAGQLMAGAAPSALIGTGQQRVPTYPPVTAPHQLYQQQQQQPTSLAASMANSVRPTSGQGPSISGMLADFSRALGEYPVRVNPTSAGRWVSTRAV